jgi:hypothetical protein
MPGKSYCPLFVMAAIVRKEIDRTDRTGCMERSCGIWDKDDKRCGALTFFKAVDRLAVCEQDGVFHANVGHGFFEVIMKEE